MAEPLNILDGLLWTSATSTPEPGQDAAESHVPASGPHVDGAPRLTRQATTVSSDNSDARIISFPDEDFEKKYPPDVCGDEASDHARVWKVYRDQAKEHDEKLLDGWNKTLDILLIFSALFSAILTAFIIESYKNLQQDYTQYTATLLFHIVSSNHMSLGRTVIDPAVDALRSPDDFTGTLPAKWVNGLWFASLVVTLSVSLTCILAKQWLDEYRSTTTATALTAHDWTRRHVRSSNSLRAWRVSFLISILPAYLHLALFLFFAGLGIFLLPLDKEIAYSTIAVTVAVLVLYITAILLPIWVPHCAFRTPLATQIRHGLDRCAQVWRSVSALVPRVSTIGYSWRNGTFSSAGTGAQCKESVLADDSTAFAAVSEGTEALSNLDAQALSWLINSAGHNVAAVTIQAISSARRSSSLGAALRLLGASIVKPLRAYKAYRMPEFSEEALSRDARLVTEYASCMHAYAVLGVVPTWTLQFAESISETMAQTQFATLKGGFRHLVNMILLEASTRGSGPDLLKLLQELLAVLEKPRTSPICTRSTALLLIDMLLGESTIVAGEPSTTVLALSLSFNLIHIAGLSSLESANLHTFGARMETWLKATTGLRDHYPERLRHIDSHMVGLETWSFIARNADALGLSHRTGEIVARGVPIWAAHFVQRAETDTSSALFPYPDFLSDFLASDRFLSYAWTKREVDALFRVFQVIRPRDHMWYRAIAHLLLASYHSSRRDGWESYAEFATVLRRIDSIETSIGLVPSHPRQAYCFLEVDQGYVTAWQALDALICQSGDVGIHVAQLAAALVSQLHHDAAQRNPDPGVSFNVIELFSVNFLDSSMRAILRSWESVIGRGDDATDWDTRPLQPSLLEVVDFVHKCALLAPDRLSKAYPELLNALPGISRAVIKHVGWLVQRRMVLANEGDLFLSQQQLVYGLRVMVQTSAPQNHDYTFLMPRELAILLAEWHPSLGSGDSVRPSLDYYLQHLVQLTRPTPTASNRPIRISQNLAEYAIQLLELELDHYTLSALGCARREDAPSFVEYLVVLHARRSPVRPVADSSMAITSPSSRQWSFPPTHRSARSTMTTLPPLSPTEPLLAGTGASRSEPVSPVGNGVWSQSPSPMAGSSFRTHSHSRVPSIALPSVDEGALASPPHLRADVPFVQSPPSAGSTSSGAGFLNVG